MLDIKKLQIERPTATLFDEELFQTGWQAGVRYARSSICRADTAGKSSPSPDSTSIPAAQRTAIDLSQIFTPWEAERYKLLSWWDMERFSAATFQQIVTGLIFLISQIENLSKMAGGEDVEAGDLAMKFVPMVQEFRGECEKLKLRTSMAFADEFIALANGMTSKNLVQGLRQLEAAVRNEMRSHLFFWVDEASFYQQRQSFGARVAVWFPELDYDITEAGNCIAFDRGTAAVFHLMRIMEVGVQRFGTRLGIPLANELNWQKILDLINSEIKARKAKDQETIILAQTSSHLYSVKLAWRNPTMHPTSKYTPQEAKEIYGSVRTFMGSLADLELALSKGQPPIV